MGDVKEMLERLNTAVVACDADFKVTYANEKCKQMLKMGLATLSSCFPFLSLLMTI